MYQALLVAAALMALMNCALANCGPACVRKSFTVYQDLVYTLEVKNDTLTTPTVSTTCKDPKFVLAPVAISNNTVLVNHVSNTFYYKWAPTADYVQGSPCDLKVTDELNDFPFLGCDFYDISVESTNSLPTVKTDICFTYL
jgi:hypothetical protein